MTTADLPELRGTTASEIAAGVRDAIEAGELREGQSLPPVRRLAERLGVNRNTVAAAYRLLATAGVVEARGGAGTVVRRRRAHDVQEGFTAGTALHDVASGNPDPALLPDLSAALAAAAPRRPTLYGEPTVDPLLARVATTWLGADLSAGFTLTLTGGAVDAVERLLQTHLAPGDVVAVEDPCFLASINAIRLAGYHALPVPVDARGMTPEGLEAALAAGARAVIVTPRAQNPTGASLDARRAADLRAVLAPHPATLVIEDDHFSRLALAPYVPVVGAEGHRWALVRSVSKFLGPDLRLAVVGSDEGTAARLATRIGPGTTWVSHLLQRATAQLLDDPETTALVASARERYAARRARFAALLQGHGLDVAVGDGLNTWVPVADGPASAVAAGLERRGWLVHTGEAFAVDGSATRQHLRITATSLDDDRQNALAEAVADAVAEAGPTV